MSEIMKNVTKFPVVDGVQATIDRHGMISICYESQAWNIPAPPFGTKYLPCEKNCGRLLVVNNNVVSVCCDDCYLKRESC